MLEEIGSRRILLGNFGLVSSVLHLGEREDVSAHET